LNSGNEDKEFDGRLMPFIIRCTLYMKINHSMIIDIVPYNQGYHTVIISKIYPYFSVLRLRKHYCPYFL